MIMLADIAMAKTSRSDLLQFEVAELFSLLEELTCYAVSSSDVLSTYLLTIRLPSLELLV